jgi:hypothetical protein
MSKKSKSRDTSKQSAEEQRKTMSLMMDKMNAMRTPIDELVGMQQNMGNEQMTNFADMFSQMMGGANQQMQNNPGLANFMQATGQQPQGSQGMGAGQPTQQGSNGGAKWGDGFTLGQSMDSSGVFADGKNQDVIDSLSSKQQPAPQQPFMQAPQQVQDQMAAAQPAPQPQQPQQPPWMANLTPEQQAAVAKYSMGPMGGR